MAARFSNSWVVNLAIAGATMNMGYNRSELAPAGNGRYAGETSLPVCVAGTMAWIATVVVETDRQRIAVAYRFEVRHRGRRRFSRSLEASLKEPESPIGGLSDTDQGTIRLSPATIGRTHGFMDKFA